jgi:transposase InsO family protein
LNVQLFETLLEAKVLLEDWRIDYNTKTALALGWLSPVEYIEA